MAVASLLDLGADKNKLQKALASCNFSDGAVELIIEEKLNMGIRGIYFNTREDHDHNHDHDHKHKHSHSHHGVHRGMKEIKEIIAQAKISENAKAIALKCFQALAEAEAEIHGKAIDEVHFHEVGARDSIVDFLGTAVCVDDLGIDTVKFSPVHLGSGLVTCAHGTIPVPAPATALLLKGMPVVIDSHTPFELTTPTGAAILKGLNALPVANEELCYDSVGHGLGSKNTGRPNFLRAFLDKSQKKN
jgi:uncharacterized protein (DUF111 family)